MMERYFLDYQWWLSRLSEVMNPVEFTCKLEPENVGFSEGKQGTHRGASPTNPVFKRRPHF